MEGGLHEDLLQRGDVRLRGPARCRGVLYDLGPYPGLVAGGARWVAGQLYRMDDPGSILPLLDALEEEAGFERRLTEVDWRHGAIPAWVYHYTGPVEGVPVIAGGSWRAYVRASRRGTGVP